VNSVSAVILTGIVFVSAAIPETPVMAPVYPMFLAQQSSKLEIRSNADLTLGNKGEERMDSQVKEFFLRYEKANSSSDVSGLGALYADTFMFGGPNGVQAISKEDFIKVLPKRKAYFSSMGLSDTQLRSVEAEQLDSKYLRANVAWRMTLHKSSHIKTLDTFATYILMRGSGDELSIVFQIDHQDLASVVKQALTAEH
jgi:ketosteroid isomerase-like protein